MAAGFRDFLVDVGVRLKEERTEAGWETLERTVADKDASIFGHAASLFSNQKKMYLCVKRGNGRLTDPTIITDIDIINEKTDALRPGYEIVEKTITKANQAKLNHKGELRLIVQRTRREEAHQGLYDIKLVSLKHQDQVPPGYRLLQHSSHDEIRIAVEFRHVAPIAPTVGSVPGHVPVVGATVPAGSGATNFSRLNGSHRRAPDPPDPSSLQRTGTLVGDRNPQERLMAGVTVKILEKYSAPVPALPPLRTQIPDLTEEDLLQRFSYDFTVELRIIENSRA